MDDAHVSQEYPSMDPANAAAVMASAAVGADLRMEKILEYLGNSLAVPNAMQASLGAVNADLLVLSYRLTRAIDEQLEPGPAGLAAFGDVMPAIEVLLKLSKQVDRYSNLDLKLQKCQVESLPALPLPSP